MGCVLIWAQANHMRIPCMAECSQAPCRLVCVCSLMELSGHEGRKISNTASVYAEEYLGISYTCIYRYIVSIRNAE